MAETQDPPARLARTVMRAADRAVLATQSTGSGWPYASLVLVALDLDATPILLVSALAEHTRNIAADDRVALLFDGTGGLAQPLEGPRVTVTGRAAPTADPHRRARYLARHPDAALYADFTDFAVHTVTVTGAHLVAGFGRIHRLGRADLMLDADATAPLAAAEAGLLADANSRFAEALDAVLAERTGRPGDGWRLTGIDPDGCDVRRDGEVARLPFAEALTDPEAVRAVVWRLLGGG
jgi:hypothetical protein